MVILAPSRRTRFPIVLLAAALLACEHQEGSGDDGAAGGGGGQSATGGASGGAGGTTPASGASGGAATTGGSEVTGSAGAGGVAQSTGGAGTGGGTVNGGALAGGAAGTGGVGGAITGGVAPTGGAAPPGGAAPTGGAESGGAITGGAAEAGGAGGADGGERLCATAAEAESATLRCPEGRIIDSVAFASYGTPTGACGSFAVGACHAESSQTVVESLCIGRAACGVPAANGAFGDPCRSTVKTLAVEVTCVPGEPIVPVDAPYKGVANSPAAELASLGATWCYNWTASPSATDCGDPLFVPMVWGPGDVAATIRAIGAAGYTTVLGFNEPNKADQANMTVAEAIELWPDLTSDPSIRVGSPAVSDDGRAWLEEFMAEAQIRGLRVDFVAMHWYGWNAGSCVASQLEGAVNWASQWGLPVWITEFGCMGSSNTDEQTLLDFFDGAIAMLEGHPLVERYAWYPWNTYNHLYLPDESGARVRTELGDAFAAAPPYRE